MAWSELDAQRRLCGAEDFFWVFEATYFFVLLVYSHIRLPTMRPRLFKRSPRSLKN